MYRGANLRVNYKDPSGKIYSFDYIAEYDSETVIRDMDMTYYISDAICLGPENDIYRKGGTWNVWTGQRLTEYLPDSYEVSRINIYIPRFAAENIGSDGLYAVDVYMHIKNIKISLCSKILNSYDMLAICTSRYDNHRFVGQFTVEMADPQSILYSDRWKSFRDYIYNETGASPDSSNYLTVSISPVVYDGTYMMSGLFNGGYNMIDITDASSYRISAGISYSNDSFILSATDGYGKKIDDLSSRAASIYGATPDHIGYDLVIGCEDNIYGASESDDGVFGGDSISDILPDIKWTDFTGGMYARGSINMSIGGNVISVISDMLPITQEVFKYMVQTEKINIDDMEFNINDIHITNTSINNVTRVDRPSGGNNMTMPVFYRTRDLADIKIFPDVTENICINLDEYKSKVNAFTIQIEGVKFKEIGRINQGILFKISGHMLPGKNMTGSYFILDDSLELVTSGKYNYSK